LVSGCAHGGMRVARVGKCVKTRCELRGTC
jgi:hypothetical protein